MSITIIKEEVSTRSYVEITRKHSQKLFGHPNASIGEIRTEAIRRKLEAIFNK